MNRIETYQQLNLIKNTPLFHIGFSEDHNKVKDVGMLGALFNKAIALMGQKERIPYLYPSAATHRIFFHLANEIVNSKELNKKDLELIQEIANKIFPEISPVRKDLIKCVEEAVAIDMPNSENYQDRLALGLLNLQEEVCAMKEFYDRWWNYYYLKKEDSCDIKTS